MSIKNMKRIYIEKRESYDYPNHDFEYNPSKKYPEYKFSEVSSEENVVYDMVRSALYGFGLDAARYGTDAWNPLGEYIKPGDRVLIKPNMVNHYSLREQNECTLTHPAVVRAIIDYCIIANAGEIVLGDAPISNADMDMIKKVNHYDSIIAFYEKKGYKISFIDFRSFVVKKKAGIAYEMPVEENSDTVKKVELGKESYHFFKNISDPMYEICGYDTEKINRYHHDETHSYVISEEPLLADVIINLPKPKTHRFAGLTASQKNFVGIVADKESVPHFLTGANQDNADETNEDSLYSKLLHKSYRIYQHKNAQKRYKQAFLCYLVYRFLLFFKSKSLYIHGQWFGNDTIWRSILDLNKIILFADKQGTLKLSKQQRTVLNIGDMIVVGEKDGPLAPSPKKYGIIMISDNMAVFDWMVCSLFGFKHELLPTVYNGFHDELLCGMKENDVVIESNLEKWNDVLLGEFKTDDFHRVIPHPFWQEVL